VSIITKSLIQTAVYWAPGGTVDGFGRPSYAAPIEISVRWIDATEQFLDSEGDTQLSRAIVMVGQDVELTGVLFLGLLTDLTSTTDPKANENAWEIRRYEKQPFPVNRVKEFFRQAFL